MTELVTQISSFEGIVASVANGADAVILSYDYEKFGMRAAEAELRRDCDYCRARDVKLYISIEHYPRDDEFYAAVEYARLAWRMGADAVVLSDVGLARAIRTAVPDMPMHAGRRTAVFGKGGVKVAAAMGFTRIYLPKEISRDEIGELSNEGLELIVTVQGDECSSIDGFCMLSAFSDGKREEKGKCTRRCREHYQTIGGRTDYPLSIKDISLIRHLRELSEMKVTGFLISGLSRQPEYTAMVTKIYNACLADIDGYNVYDAVIALSEAYKGGETTDKFYLGEKGELMNGSHDFDQSENPRYPEAKRAYRTAEFNRVPVDFIAVIRKGESAKLAARDKIGNIARIEGPVPRNEGTFEVRRSTVVAQCRLTGGTPYLCTGVRTVIDKGVFLSAQEISSMVTDALSVLSEKRKTLEERSVYSYSMPKSENKTSSPKLTVSVLKLSQLSDELYRLAPSVLYIPVEEIKDGSAILNKFIYDRNISVCAVLPKVIKDRELSELIPMLKKIKAQGINEISVSDMSHIVMGLGLGFKVRGDIGLNIHNSEAMSIFGRMGLISAVVSPQVRLDLIAGMAKPINAEILAYGRLPLMYTENCIIRNSSGFCFCENMERLSDSTGTSYSVSGGFGCRSTVYSGKKLFIADKKEDYENIGIWGVRLCFTTENANECVRVAEQYKGIGRYSPNLSTRGLYYKNAE